MRQIISGDFSLVRGLYVILFLSLLSAKVSVAETPESKAAEAVLQTPCLREEELDMRTVSDIVSSDPQWQEIDRDRAYEFLFNIRPPEVTGWSRSLDGMAIHVIGASRGGTSLESVRAYREGRLVPTWPVGEFDPIAPWSNMEREDGAGFFTCTVHLSVDAFNLVDFLDDLSAREHGNGPEDGPVDTYSISNGGADKHRTCVGYEWTSDRGRPFGICEEKTREGMSIIHLVTSKHVTWDDDLDRFRLPVQD